MIENIKEFKLNEIIKILNKPNSKELIEIPFKEFKIKYSDKIIGDINIFNSNKGQIIRFTETKDWIRFVKFIVEKNCNNNCNNNYNNCIVLIDFGFQFYKLFEGNEKVILVSHDEIAGTNGARRVEFNMKFREKIKNKNLILNIWSGGVGDEYGGTCTCTDLPCGGGAAVENIFGILNFSL